MIDLSILDNNLNDSVSYSDYFKAFGYKEDDTIYIRTFYDPGNDDDKSKNYDVRKWNFKSIIPTLQRLNSDRIGIFYVVNGGGQKDRAVKMARAQFIDIDDNSFVEQIKMLNEFPLEPSIIVKTSRSLHCYWLLNDGDITQFRGIQKRLIQRFHSDRKNKNESRVMRVYGFLHQKADPVMVKLIKFDPEIRYTQVELSAVLPEVEEEKPTLDNVREIDSIPESSEIAYISRDERARWFLKWANRQGVEILSKKEVGDKYIFAVKCPWEDLHTDNTGRFQTAVIVEVSGKLGFVCMHSHCEDKSWSDFREYYEPDYKNKTSIKEDEPKIIVLPKKLSAVVEKKVDWLVNGYIPRNGITILAADGGAGKTSTECAITASITSGKRPFLLGEVPRDFETQYSQPGTVLFLSGEDYAEYTIAKKIRAMGGDLDRVSIVDPSDEILEKCKIGSEYLKRVVDAIKPDLVIIDPLQAFIERDVNMGMRNQMRQALQPINELASKFGFAVIIAVHSNKRDAVSGRNRVSDSSDIWDMARSVLMVGTADSDTGQRYLSHEKSNWSMLSQTVLFSIINNGCIQYDGFTEKKDADFQREASQTRNKKKNAPTTQEVKDFIIEVLKSGDMSASDLKKAVEDNGWTATALKRARTELQNEHIIKQYRIASGQGRGTLIFWKLTKKLVSL